MFKKTDGSSNDFSERPTKSLHKSVADSQPGSIIHRQAQSEINYRKERNPNIFKTIGFMLAIITILVGVAKYFN